MIGDVFGALATIAVSAYIVETLVEAFFGRIVSNVPKVAPYKWLTYYIAIAVGVAMALVYSFDLIYLAAKFSESPVEVTKFGIVITGFSIGSGASYIHQIISKFFPAKKPPAADWAVTNGQE
jgi:hypothetical protein